MGVLAILFFVNFWLGLVPLLFLGLGLFIYYSVPAWEESERQRKAKEGKVSQIRSSEEYQRETARIMAQQDYETEFGG